ncbi:uncharacterized protein LOC105392891 isoform X3 [Plutella xylostella]|uniref:uncharacterized protein LOC105392891 isoform X3 n=1 Tax=Plutella xylostella TaxID=51655 RepID=UPI0020329DFB|nr:uncharacterized protein LOC105392891 isoform X3 [Plutella xylostella]
MSSDYASYSKKRDQETHTPMLKVFKDMMNKKDNEIDPERVSLLKDNKSVKNPKSYHVHHQREDSMEHDNSEETNSTNYEYLRRHGDAGRAVGDTDFEVYKCRKDCPINRKPEKKKKEKDKLAVAVKRGCKCRKHRQGSQSTQTSVSKTSTDSEVILAPKKSPEEPIVVPKKEKKEKKPPPPPEKKEEVKQGVFDRLFRKLFDKLDHRALCVLLIIAIIIVCKQSGQSCMNQLQNSGPWSNQRPSVGGLPAPINVPNMVAGPGMMSAVRKNFTLKRAKPLVQTWSVVDEEGEQERYLARRDVGSAHKIKHHDYTGDAYEGTDVSSRSSNKYGDSAQKGGLMPRSDIFSRLNFNALEEDSCSKRLRDFYQRLLKVDAELENMKVEEKIPENRYKIREKRSSRDMIKRNISDTKIFEKPDDINSVKINSEYKIEEIGDNTNKERRNIEITNNATPPKTIGNKTVTVEVLDKDDNEKTSATSVKLHDKSLKHHKKPFKLEDVFSKMIDKYPKNTPETLLEIEEADTTEGKIDLDSVSKILDAKLKMNDEMQQLLLKSKTDEAIDRKVDNSGSYNENYIGLPWFYFSSFVTASTTAEPRVEKLSLRKILQADDDYTDSMEYVEADDHNINHDDLVKLNNMEIPAVRIYRRVPHYDDDDDDDDVSDEKSRTIFEPKGPASSNILQVLNNPNWKGPLPLYPDEVTSMSKAPPPEPAPDVVDDELNLNDLDLINDVNLNGGLLYGEQKLDMKDIKAMEERLNDIRNKDPDKKSNITDNDRFYYKAKFCNKYADEKVNEDDAANSEESISINHQRSAQAYSDYGVLESDHKDPCLKNSHSYTKNAILYDAMEFVTPSGGLPPNQDKNVINKIQSMLKLFSHRDKPAEVKVTAACNNRPRLNDVEIKPSLKTQVKRKINTFHRRRLKSLNYQDNINDITYSTTEHNDPKIQDHYNFGIEYNYIELFSNYNYQLQADEDLDTRKNVATNDDAVKNDILSLPQNVVVNMKNNISKTENHNSSLKDIKLMSKTQDQLTSNISTHEHQNFTDTMTHSGYKKFYTDWLSLLTKFLLKKVENGENENIVTAKLNLSNSNNTQIGHVSRNLMSISDEENTNHIVKSPIFGNITPSPEVSVEIKALSDDLYSHPISVSPTTIYAPNVTQEIVKRDGDTAETATKAEASNKTIVKRQAPLAGSGIIFWNDMYDDEYQQDYNVKGGMEDRVGSVRVSRSKKKHKKEKSKKTQTDKPSKLHWLKSKLRRARKKMKHAKEASLDKAARYSQTSGPSLRVQRQLDRGDLSYFQGETRSPSSTTEALIEDEFDTNTDEDVNSKMSFSLLTAHMQEVVKQAAHAVEQGTKNVKVRENKVESELPDSLMEQLVKVMTEIIDNQVEDKTCLQLPSDLREFLAQLTANQNAEEPSKNTDYFKNTFVEMKDPEIDAEANTFSPSNVKYMETLGKIEGLQEDYDHLRKDEKNRLFGVKSYLEEQEKFIRDRLDDNNAMNLKKSPESVLRIRRDTELNENLKTSENNTITNNNILGNKTDSAVSCKDSNDKTNDGVHASHFKVEKQHFAKEDIAAKTFNSTKKCSVVDDIDSKLKDREEDTAIRNKVDGSKRVDKRSLQNVYYRAVSEASKNYTTKGSANN